jgi:hypothetical protein
LQDVGAGASPSESRAWGGTTTGPECAARRWTRPTHHDPWRCAASAAELLAWGNGISGCQATFLVHGEELTTKALAGRLESGRVEMPRAGEIFDLCSRIDHEATYHDGGIDARTYVAAVTSAPRLDCRQGCRAAG